MGQQPAQRDVRQAADVVRRLLVMVDDGTLTTDDNPSGKRLLRRLEGAAAALEASAGERPAVVPRTS